MKTMTICGVEFQFDRVPNVRSVGKHWQITVKKTGTVMECFPGKTLKEKIWQIQQTARIVGPERFKRDSEAA